VNHFQYREDRLFCEEVDLAEIARVVGTPFYVYSAATLSRHYRVFDEALSSVPHLICYSVKANSNLAVLHRLFQLGAGADIVSGGELYRALEAGGDPQKIVFSGVGKTREEMRYALSVGILAFNVESIAELRVLSAVAGEAGKRAPVSLRINPDVDAETHPYISTGLRDNKFGIAAKEALGAYQEAVRLPNLDVVGIDCHIGSQLTKTAPFQDAVARISLLYQEIAGIAGVELQHLDIGGGLGIPYGDREAAEPPSPEEYSAAILKGLAPVLQGKNAPTIICEPGRVIAGNAGALVTRVLYEKPTESKKFLVVDAAFNDLMRPALYQGYHPMQPVRRFEERAEETVDVVGPICESGDFLARDRKLPQLREGELLSIGAAGAYGFSMSSNYNSRPRVAEVMVSAGRFEIIRRRECREQLIENEQIPDSAFWDLP